MTTSVSRKIILADIANLAEIAFIADIAKLANLAEPSRLRIADKVSRAEPSRFSNGHLYVAHMVHIILQKIRQSQGLPQATLIVFIARQIILHRDPSHRGGIGADLERWQVLMFPVWSSNTAIHFVCFIYGSNLPSVRFTTVTARLARPDWPRSSPAIPADKFCHSADLPLLSIARPAIFARRPLEASPRNLINIR